MEVIRVKTGMQSEGDKPAAWIRLHNGLIS